MILAAWLLHSIRLAAALGAALLAVLRPGEHGARAGDGPWRPRGRRCHWPELGKDGTQYLYARRERKFVGLDRLDQQVEER